MSEIYSIVYQPTPSVHQPPYHYTRVPVDHARLIAGGGIAGDRKGQGNPKRQLNIMSFETVEALRAEGYKADPGELGEQIIVRGLDVALLQPGQRLRLGDQAVIEIYKPRTGCDWFEQIQEKPRQNTVGRLGMMAGVVVEGEIRVGDSVQVLALEAQP